MIAVLLYRDAIHGAQPSREIRHSPKHHTWVYHMVAKCLPCLPASASNCVVRFMVSNNFKAIGHASVKICRGKVNSTMYRRHIPQEINQWDESRSNCCRSTAGCAVIGCGDLGISLEWSKTDMRVKR